MYQRAHAIVIWFTASPRTALQGLRQPVVVSYLQIKRKVEDIDGELWGGSTGDSVRSEGDEEQAQESERARHCVST